MKSKRLIPLLLLICVFTLLTPEYCDAAAYRSYNYDYWGEALPTPDPYVPEKIIDLNQYVKDLRDIYVTADGNIWAADSSNNRIVVVNQDGELVRIIDSFVTESGQQKLNSPESVFVNSDGIIYIADTGNQRIVILNSDGEFKNIIEFDPEAVKKAQIFAEGFRFRPRSIGQGVGDKLYVISAGVYDGIMEFTSEGIFEGFIGAPRVTPSPWEVFWYRVATEEQRARRRLFIPVEFSKLDIDEIGFIYTTVASSEDKSQIVKRLSPSGTDSLIRSGKHPVVGDILISGVDPYSGMSTLIDIAVRENGLYSVLDSKRGRVFTYDSYGNLLYIFGGPGSHDGMFNRPSAIDTYEEKILVADRGKNTITVFKPTVYAQAIHAAIEYYERGDYDKSAEMWRQVLKFDAGYEMAYTGIGRNYLLQEDFATAMYYFRLGEDRTNYSKAFDYYRNELVTKNASKIISGIVIIIGLIVLMVKLGVPMKVKSQVSAALALEPGETKSALRTTLEGVWYAKHIIFHPFDGFWDVKHEKRGNVASATVILALVLISMIINIFNTGFVINTRDIRYVNIWREMASVLATFILWCAVNWGFTTLTDGKGSFKDIYIYSAYALTPMILILIPITIFSNYITADESYFYYLFYSIAVIWSMGLLFIGTITTHDYSLGKAVLSILIIVVGIVVVAFIGLLFFMIIDRLILFVMDLYNEIVYRV